MIANHLPPKTLQMKCPLENAFRLQYYDYIWLQIRNIYKPLSGYSICTNSAISRYLKIYYITHAFFSRFLIGFSSPQLPFGRSDTTKTLSWRISSAQGRRIITKPGGLSCSPSSSTSAFGPGGRVFGFFSQIRWVEKNRGWNISVGDFFDAWKSRRQVLFGMETMECQ